jgi:hypothetical protein
MLRAQARASFRVLDQRGFLFLTPRVQTASISSSAKIISSSRRQNRSSTIPSASTARAMSTHYGESAIRLEPDMVVQDIADYDSDLAWETARPCLIDTIGRGLEGLGFPECRSLFGPGVEDTVVPNGEPYHTRAGTRRPSNTTKRKEKAMAFSLPFSLYPLGHGHHLKSLPGPMHRSKPG